MEMQELVKGTPVTIFLIGFCKNLGAALAPLSPTLISDCRSCTDCG